MTSSPFTRTAASSRLGADDRPVLAVVFDDATALSVLDRACTVAEVLDAPLAAVLLHPRDGFSTDAALLARTARQRRRRLETLLAGLRHSPGSQPVGVLSAYGRRPRRSRVLMFARIVAATARRHDARLVVVPVTLERTVPRLPVPTIVVTPTAASTGDG